MSSEMRHLTNIIRSQLVEKAYRALCSRMAHKWGYAHSDLPPAEWHKDYADAKGNHQSPINFVSASSTRTSFDAFNISYQPTDVKSVSNNGHSVTFHVENGNSVLSGGPLNHKYKLEQFHFHWGGDSSKGSEHLLDGKSFAAEVHLVHWNADKYKSFADSLSHPDGLCVLGAFLEASGNCNPAYEKVVDDIKRVPLKGDKKDVGHELDPRLLLPEDISSYFHYSGSLTTPPLKECVQWVVFKTPVKLSERQLAAYRSVHIGDAKSACLCDNFRPVQPLNQREVFST